MATSYYVEHVHIVQIRAQIPTPYVCIAQESESESLPVSESGNVYKSLQRELYLIINYDVEGYRTDWDLHL